MINCNNSSRDNDISQDMDNIDCIFIEPFYGGSHKRMIDLLMNEFKVKYKTRLFTLPDKKWHWRLLCSAVQFATDIPYINENTSSSLDDDKYKFGTLFVTSMVNLSDLIALRIDLAKRYKILYFHENQLTYPSMQTTNSGSSKSNNNKKKWSEYGWAQVISCCCADIVLFNSEYNKSSFLSAANQMLSIIPAPSRPQGIIEKITTKCKVLYYPLQCPSPLEMKTLSQQQTTTKLDNDEQTLYIVWAHRWENDKGPQRLWNILKKLKETPNLKFRLAILGEQSVENPPVFDEMKDDLFNKNDDNNNIEVIHFGQVTYSEYIETLQKADISLSTSFHEFYGVSMLESTYFGCYPLVPNDLVYPEIYPKQCLYNTEQQVYKKLKDFIIRPYKVRSLIPSIQKEIQIEKYHWNHLSDKFENIIFGSSSSSRNSNSSSSSSSMDNSNNSNNDTHRKRSFEDIK